MCGSKSNRLHSSNLTIPHASAPKQRRKVRFLSACYVARTQSLFSKWSTNHGGNHMENIFSRAKAVIWSRRFSSANVVSCAVCAYGQEVSRAFTHAFTPADTSPGRTTRSTPKATSYAKVALRSTRRPTRQSSQVTVGWLYYSRIPVLSHGLLPRRALRVTRHRCYARQLQRQDWVMPTSPRHLFLQFATAIG